MLRHMVHLAVGMRPEPHLSAHALLQAMEHKLECRECGNWRRVRGYGPFVRVRCDFICSKLPGRTCQQPCDVCGAAGGCECLD